MIDDFIEELLVPEEGIDNYRQVMKVLAAHITNSGGTNSINNKVKGVTSINAKATLLKTDKKGKTFTPSPTASLSIDKNIIQNYI